MGMVRALAMRDDQYVEDIIGPLLVQLDHEREAIMEAYLQALVREEPDRIGDWATVNGSLLDALIRSLGELTRTHLRGAVLRLAARSSRVDLASYLAAFATDLLSGSLTGPPSPYEELALLEALSATGSPDLAMAAISMAQSSRNPVIVAEARRVAATLLAGRGGSP